MNRIIASGALVCGAACTVFAARSITSALQALDALTAVRSARSPGTSEPRRRETSGHPSSAVPGGLHRQHLTPPEHASPIRPEDPHAPPTVSLQVPPAYQRVSRG